MNSIKEGIIAVVGLGYVGLPLAVEFGKNRKVIGYDVSLKRISELKKGKDSTKETEYEDLLSANKLFYTNSLEDIKECSIYIIAVPTPINADKTPNLAPLEKSSEEVGRVITKDNIVIYESTVFPGATEEVCVPILEKFSGLEFNKDFFCGYSPERINPGDKEHKITNIKKITSGSLPEIAILVDELYLQIISAGTHMVSSIRVAEAAKVIENIQRDVNIALVNELAMLFNKLDIDTLSVLEAAGTKWNFLPFRPGLVGGHCISVDPYYLTYKANQIGFKPEIILAGRNTNDKMSIHIVEQVSKLMISKNIQISSSNVLIMGLTFKENCPDLRNSLVVDVVKEFQKLACNVEVFDPLADKEEAKLAYDILPIEYPSNQKYDAILLTVGHDDFKKLSIKDIKAFGKNICVVYDIKYILDSEFVDGRL
ncbi:Vi polysaccharide biosynthesis UDP-N-acetylglucosamine C-6 dehydrogenase TviB [Candidatus Thioglobus sp.]|nr:Vi polysaccharide biosynthesis UDP-N-acetylglucosamine C-6 dehydrogenase TviB [Candidatus Thioglobus sp.]